MKKNYFYVDLIKVVSIFLVVFLHTAGFHLSQWGKVATNYWMYENIYDSFTRMSVPLFIMISGAMLLQKEEAYGDFFKKRLSKIGIPAIVWILIYLFWRVFALRENLGKRQMLELIITGPVYYHLWFLYMIVGMYLMTPILRKITRNSTSKDFLYFICIWFIFVSVVPTTLFLLKARFGINLELGITIPFLTGHVRYFILGYYLNGIEPKKSHVRLCWAGFILSWISTTFGTLYVTTISNGFSDIFYSYFSPTVAIEAVSCFILLSYYGRAAEKNLSSKTKSIFSKLAVASFGVYLVHPLILDVLLKFHLFFSVVGLKINPLISNPLAAIELFSISYIITLVILEIPVLNLIVGGGTIKPKQSNITESA